MDESFDPDRFVRRIGERLVDEFNDAKAGTTSATVGAAAEQPVRDQLEQVLPRGIAVGEGFVIDSYGGTSRQQDVILYERDICPVFSINQTPQTTYYPCEGVIAVGEIKSLLDRNELQDAFNKVASVKRLRRHMVPYFMPDPTTGEPIALNRNYLTPVGDSGNSIINVHVERSHRDRLQIFGFVLAGESRLKRETLLDTFCALSHEEVEPMLLPNFLASLDKFVIMWGNIANQERRETYRSENGTFGVRVFRDGPERWQTSWSTENATHVGGSEDPEPFRSLVYQIRQVATLGRTSDVSSFDHYFKAKKSLEVQIYPNPVKSRGV